MAVYEIPSGEWASFLGAFARQHRGWLVTIERGGTVAARNVPLQNVALDSKSTGENSISIAIGPRAQPKALPLRAPKRLWFFETEGGAHSGIDIEGASDSLSLRFRTAARPELVNGHAEV